MSRQLGLSRHVFSATDVATAESCRDLNSLYLMSRQLNVVATFSSLQQMSRPLNDVATSFPCFCCRDCLMMSRPPVFHNYVATVESCRDLLSLADDVATLISFQADVATASVSVLMLRLHPYVTT